MEVHHHKVVNVKVANIRPKYNNLEEWINDPNTAFINGRRYPERDSPYCNPYKIGIDGNREDVLLKFEKMFKSKPELIERAKKELKGKDLGCWCHPEKCHADILLKYVND
jgi:hypothetical protein